MGSVSRLEPTGVKSSLGHISKTKLLNNLDLKFSYSRQRNARACYKISIWIVNKISISSVSSHPPWVHCNTSTFPLLPLATSWGEAVHVMSDSERSSLLFLISVKVSYRELQIMFYYLIIFMNQPNIAVNASLLLTQSGILWLIIFLFRLSCSASSSGARL